MSRRSRAMHLFVGGLLALAPVLGAQNDTKTNFTRWLEERAIARARVKAEAMAQQADSATRQEGTLSSSKNTTSLVDQSSASDLLAVAANLAGLSTGKDQTAANSTSATVTLFALYAALKRTNGLDPVFYNGNRDLRRILITLGYDEDKNTGASHKRGLYGLKGIVINGRQVNDGDRTKLEEKIKGYASKLGQIRQDAMNVLILNPERFQEFSLEYTKYVEGHPDKCPKPAPSIDSILATVRARNPTLQDQCEPNFVLSWDEAKLGAGFTETFLSSKDKATIDELIEAHLDSLSELQTTTEEVLAQIRNRPQLSISIQTKDLGSSRRSYTAEAIYDYGFADVFTLTANAGFVTSDPEAGKHGRQNSGKFSTQLRYALIPGTVKRKATYLDFSGEATHEGSATYKAQVKLSLPLTSGLELPLSFTYANRTELIKERDVRGQVGFTLDFAQLLKQLKP